MKHLFVQDEVLRASEFSDLAITAQKCNCEDLQLLSCDLSVEKLSEFGETCKSDNVKVVTKLHFAEVCSVSVP